MDFRLSVRKFAAEVVAPHAESIDKNNSFPSEINLWKAMGDMGLHGITVPEEYGGSALGVWPRRTFRLSWAHCHNANVNPLC